MFVFARASVVHFVLFFFVHVVILSLFLVVSTSECRERTVSEMIDHVSSRM